MIIHPKRWDIFAKVVDNFGDAGVAWRLARQLAQEHGLDVTLYLDDLTALARLAPDAAKREHRQRVHDVRVVRWVEPFVHEARADVVIEAFGCGVPESYASLSTSRASPPQWFVLEYLSAEAWIEAMHGLPSPHPRLPLIRRFWFPGFTAKTGGLLRERGLLTQRDAFQSDACAIGQWWTSIGIQPPTEALTISLFCYPNPALPELLDAWAEDDRPIVCLVPEGVAAGALDVWSGGAVPHPGGPPLTRGNLTLQVLPFLSQDDYDRLLWACAVNFVRGEDSFVRAQWAARPLVWHIYPQENDAHAAKLGAFIDRYTARLDRPSAERVAALIGAWNGVPDATPAGAAWLEFAAALAHLRCHGSQWAADLSRLPELATGLVKAAQAKL